MNKTILGQCQGHFWPIEVIFDIFYWSYYIKRWKMWCNGYCGIAWGYYATWRATWGPWSCWFIVRLVITNKMIPFPGLYDMSRGDAWWQNNLLSQISTLWISSFIWFYLSKTWREKFNSTSLAWENFRNGQKKTIFSKNYIFVTYFSIF